MRRALVTGATGFLGGHLARRLAADGWAVTALGRDAARAPDLPFVKADLADREAVERACRGQEVVFHCAALSSPWGPYEAFHRANVVGTRNVAEACLAQGVARLVHVSTPSVYFDFRDREGIREDDPLPPRSVNAYAATKRLAEEVVDAAHARGLATVTLRPRGLFGPGDTAILPRLVRANEAGRLPLFDGGRARIDVTFVDNCVDALVLAADAPASGRRFNITNGEPTTVGDLLPQIFAALGMPYRPRRMGYRAGLALATALELAARWRGGAEPLLTRYAVGLLAKHQTLDLTLAREVLGYAPRIPLAQGIARFAEWYRCPSS